MACNGMMPFFPTNFMQQTSHDGEDDNHHHHHHQHPILPSSSTPHDFHGMAQYLGNKRSMSFSGLDICEETTNGVEEGLSDDDGSQTGEKKRRLNIEQVRTLEKNFELGNKLEPERKMQLAKALGLQPRQIAIWFQNRRARWKTKQLEKDYDLLKKQFDSVKADNDALQAQNHKLHAEIMAMKNREPTESINLNKETEGSSSYRSENSSDIIKLDISRTGPIDGSDFATNPIANDRVLFPSSSSRPRSTGLNMSQFFLSSSSKPENFQYQKIDNHHHNHNHSVKEESFTNMFCGIDDQPGFWPSWLEQHQFN